jgi:hypothetical protein
MNCSLSAPPTSPNWLSLMNFSDLSVVGLWLTLLLGFCVYRFVLLRGVRRNISEERIQKRLLWIWLIGAVLLFLVAVIEQGIIHPWYDAVSQWRIHAFGECHMMVNDPLYIRSEDLQDTILAWEFRLNRCMIVGLLVWFITLGEIQVRYGVLRFPERKRQSDGDDKSILEQINTPRVRPHRRG